MLCLLIQWCRMNKAEPKDNLMQRISAGDTEAFRVFYDLYSSQVYRYSRYFVKSEETCEEIVSDVFMNVWNNRNKLTEIEKIEAYLYIITRNKSYNYLDKESRLPGISSEIPNNIQVENLNPENLLLTKELEKAINSAINELPEKCRIIFLMSREGCLKYHQIAEILSISEKTVHAQIVTALKKLNAAIGKFTLLAL